MLLRFALPSFVSLISLATAYHVLSDETLRHLPGPGHDFDIHKGSLLAPILVPRVSGTEGNAAVRQHFLDFFSSQLPEWRVELHNSTSTTPVSKGNEVPFVNIIATRDPPTSRPGDVSRLALVAHYDSKYTPEGFIGATDSAAPCAMLMHVARSIDAALSKKWAHGGPDMVDAEHKGVQIILLDGEEAFRSWTDTDSLYGARWDTWFHHSTYVTNRAAVRSQRTGSRLTTQRHQHIAPLSIRSSFLSSSISLVRKILGYRHTSRPPTGPINTWPRQKTVCEALG